MNTHVTRHLSLVTSAFIAAATATTVAARTVSVSSVSASGASLAFGGADGAAYTLAWGYGATDGGSATNAWDTFEVLGTVAAGDTSRTVALPAGWGSAVSHLRFFLLESGIPADATRLEYIESTGSQYIDTGIRGKVGVTAEIDLMCRQMSDSAVLGSRTQSGNYRFFVVYWNTYNFLGGIVDNWYYRDFTIVTDTRYLVRSVMKNGTQTCSVNGTQIGSNNKVSTFDSEATLALFALHYKDGTYHDASKARIYSAKIWVENATTGADDLVRDFVPCRDGNGEACLYDHVSGTYFRNAGSGTFTAGGEVSTVAASTATVAATIGASGSADTVVWDEPFLPDGMSLVKIGSNRAIVQTESAITADIDVRGGSMVFSGRTCTNEFYRFVFNGTQYDQQNQIAIGDLRVYSGTTTAEDVAYGIGANGNFLAAGTSPANLARGQCVSSFTTTTTKPSGKTVSLWDWRYGFDNNRTQAVLSKDTYFIYNNASQVWVAFRMAEGNNRVQSYLPFTSWLDWWWHPSAWHFQTSVDGVNWQTVDTRTGVLTSSGYGSTPFVIKGFLADNAAGFDPSANVKVASGATLDATGVAGGQTLSHLTIDWAAGAGTIRGVAIAQNGVLDLVNVPAGTDLGGTTVPVTLASVENGANFASWTVRVDGVATEDTVFWNGSALLFPTTSIGGNGTADTLVWDDPVLVDGMPLVKVGSNRAIVQTASAIDADIDVQGGSLVFSGRTCTNEWYRFLFNGTQYNREDPIAIGDLKVFSDTAGIENIALGIGANGNVLSAGTSPANLAPGQCVAHFATTDVVPEGVYAELSDMSYAFDGTTKKAVLSADTHYIYNNARQTWVAFRMAEGNNRVRSYLPVKSNATWYWHPSAWLFQTSVDGVNWQTVDVRTGAISSSGYGSTPFVIKGFLADGAAGFDPSANVKVASGATLDASGVAGGQSLSHLTVDWATGAGTITGVTIAAGGVLDLVNVPAGTKLGGKTIPVTLSGLSGAANFGTWTLRVNGTATNERLYWNGRALRIPGAVIVTVW